MAITSLITDVALAFADSRSLQEMLRACTESMVPNLGAAFARIWTLNEATRELELQASSGMYTHLDGPHGRVPVGKFKIGLIAQEKLPQLTNDVLHDSRISDTEWARREGLVAFAGYPLLAQDVLLGVVAIFARHPLSERVLETLAVVGKIMSVGIRRKQAEQELLRLNTAVRAAANGIVITDREGNILWVNPAFTRMTGYTKDEAIGKSTRILNSGVHDSKFYQELWSTIIAGGVWRGVMCNRRKDGTLYHEEMTITPILDETGKVVQFVAIKEDITDKEHLRVQLQQSQKMEAVGMLAGGVAHDFNNLLTIISGYSELLLTTIPASDPRREMVKSVAVAGERAAGLTRQLLAFSRKTVLEPRVLDLNSVVEETEKMLRRMIGEDILLTSTLEPHLALVKVDPTQLGQVLINLAINARDAMPKGGKLTIETANVDLDSRWANTHEGAKPGHYVLLAVTDSGIGMSSEVQVRIFEPFFTTKGVGLGTGLGLAVVLGIVQQSGGSVDVYSEVGFGTTFKIYFPAVTEEVRDRVIPTSTSLFHGTETICLVEDEESVREMARFVFQSHGYTVLHASGGKQALDLLEQHNGHVDILVTDVVMPSMSGRELADSLQSLRSQIKVLYTSGYTDDAVVRHGILQAEVAFLQKPYTPMSLLRKVRQVLDRK